MPAAALLVPRARAAGDARPAPSARRRRSPSARRWGSPRGFARWRCRSRRSLSATGWRFAGDGSGCDGAARRRHRRRRRRDTARAAALGRPPRAPERRALLHRRSRRHHRADRRQPELGGHVHARAEPPVQGRHRAQRARRAAPRDRSRRLRDGARVVALRAAATRSASRRCKADRLFDPEHRLLYWSIFRPGVLVGRPAALFARRRDAIVRFADGFGLAVAGARARRRRARGRAPALARCSSLVPFPARALSRPTRSSSPSLATGCRSRCWRFRSSRWRSARSRAPRPRRAGALARDLLRAAKAARSRAGRRSSRGGSPGPRCSMAARTARARHRWAVTEVELDGRTRTLLWAPAARRLRGAVSPLAGAPNGVHLRVGDDGEPTALRAAARRRPAPGGRYRFHAARRRSGRRPRALRARGTRRRRRAGRRPRRAAGRPPSSRDRPPGWTVAARGHPRLRRRSRSRWVSGPLSHHVRIDSALPEVRSPAPGRGHVNGLGWRHATEVARSSGCSRCSASLGCHGKYIRPVSDEPIAAEPARLQRGSYLVNQVLFCGACHTSREHGNMLTEPERTDAFLGGGQRLRRQGDRHALDPQHHARRRDRHRRAGRTTRSCARCATASRRTATSWCR